MKIKFIIHDDARAEGARITDEVSIYIPIGKFLVLAHDVLSGVYARKKRDAIQAGAKYPTYFEHYGGSRTAPITFTRFALLNGKTESAEFAFLATSGAGKLTATGGIQPVGKAEAGASDIHESSIFINMPDEKLKEFLLIGKAYIEQYVALDIQGRLESVRAQREAYRESQR